jgi:Hg(II)-responsive transcriptional regulator
MDMDTEELFKIGEAAAAAGVRVQTLRYYEQRKLLDRPGRTEGGFRLYPKAAIRRVRFIKKAQALGFTLEEIAELLALDGSPAVTCGDFRPLVDRKVADIATKMRQLRRLRVSLLALRERCPGTAAGRSECPILASLEEDR